MKKRLLVILLLQSILFCSCHPSLASSYSYMIKDATATIISHEEQLDEKHIEVPQKLGGYTVTALGPRSFYQHKALRSITLPDTLETVEGASFYRCYSLEKLHLPDSISKIECNPVFRCSALSEITVSPNNSFYTTNDGVLYNKEKTQMIAYPEGKTQRIYTVPRSVKKLNIDSFGYHPKVKHIVIYSNVNQFPDGNMFVFPDEITLYVEAGSLGEKYAKMYGLNYKVITQPEEISIS